MSKINDNFYKEIPYLTNYLDCAYSQNKAVKIRFLLSEVVNYMQPPDGNVLTVSLPRFALGTDNCRRIINKTVDDKLASRPHLRILDSLHKICIDILNLNLLPRCGIVNSPECPLLASFGFLMRFHLTLTLAALTKAAIKLLISVLLVPV